MPAHRIIACLLIALAACAPDRGQPGWDVEPLPTSDASASDASSRDTEEPAVDMGEDMTRAPPESCVDDTASCPVQSPASFGDCDQPLGVVFDGTRCVPTSGCDCEGDGCPAFDSVVECATTCAAAGECNEDALQDVDSAATCRVSGGEYYFGACFEPDRGDPTESYGTIIDHDNVQTVFTCYAKEEGANTLCKTVFVECRGDAWCCESAGSVIWESGEEATREQCALSLLPGFVTARSFDRE